PGGQQQKAGQINRVQDERHGIPFPSKVTKARSPTVRMNAFCFAFSCFRVFVIAFCLCDHTAALRIWQFLYFLPLPQGQGSLRPTRSRRLRMGSIFLSLAWFVDIGCPLALMVGRGAASWTAAPMAHTDS